MSDSKPDASRRGLLLVGHGSRSQEAQLHFLQLAEAIAQVLPAYHVQPAFLELAEPTIAEAVERLAQAGVDRLTVLPAFLLAAGHVRRDVPSVVTAALKSYPQIAYRFAAHFGCQEQVVQGSVACYHAALGSPAASPSAERLLVIVGRGAKDPQAADEMRAFARLHAQQSQPTAFEVCFYAMALPRFSERLAELPKTSYREIVVQPHLLFVGDLYQRICEQVEQTAQADRTGRVWRVAEPLGPTNEVRDAAVQLVTQAQRDRWPMNC